MQNNKSKSQARPSGGADSKSDKAFYFVNTQQWHFLYGWIIALVSYTGAKA